MTERHPYDQLIEEMKQKGIVFERGLTDEELHYIGKLGGFTFPPDLAEFLMRGVPIGREYILYGKHRSQRIASTIGMTRRGIPWKDLRNGFCKDSILM